MSAVALGTLPALVGHRLLQRTWAVLDVRGGHARALTREHARVAAMLGNGSLEEWLARPGAGQLWLPAGAARRWARRSCSPADLEWAGAVVAGRYSMLGVGSAELGNPPRWHRDLYTGQDWPLSPVGELPLSRGDGGDIRTLWELSRCYHFVPLAKAFWKTGDPEYLQTYRRHVESWLEANPVGLGANWRSPMDVAIRAANWALAAVLFAESAALSREFWVSVLVNLRLSARFVLRRLEWHPRYRGNHYLSNGVGLAYVGALFRDDPDGARWLRRGARILRDEMRFQVAGDGVSLEAAIGYHRLVSEFFAFGGEVCERNLPGFLPPSYWDRLRRMYGFIQSYLDAHGRAPRLGDADDGRLHQLCALAAANPDAHRLGLPGRHWPRHPPAPARFPEGGFYVLRSGSSRCIVRCGALGLHGAGTHDHNDQLSYELSLRGASAVCDSGTYCYTRDLEERFAFRATSAHNAIQLGLEEQNPIRPERPWRTLSDRTRSRCTSWESAAERAIFGGSHAGFSHRRSGAICSRWIGVDRATDVWTIRDRVEGRGREDLTWRTHFAPGRLSVRETEPGVWCIEHDRVRGYRFVLSASFALAPRVRESRLSERYGAWVTRPMLEVRAEVDLPVELTLLAEPLSTPGEVRS